ncbi:HNH endonuclease [Streptomyces sp. S3(2020)]|uniref:HNH endonuclease n=1 Tax=Streptomyces sp. S3(2020) TaxID=2732044 RepID=UPI001488C3A4|nr:HNH endonuclease signature motif containing protein [Streptomyces sp. S3(2020)]NNN37649.1 HNH endonuclease [Streptomyces sp. S3(2020)]
MRQPLRQQLEGLEEHVVAASARFETAAQAASLHSLDRISFTPASPDMAAALPDVYTQRMAKVGRPGRAIYDELKMAAVVCPLCGHREVTTLDHHLPKSMFPLLAVTPSNLVPCCSECNRTKRSTAPREAEEQTLHPYFDNIDDERWLAAEVLQGTPVALSFFVQPPQDWPNMLQVRVRHHFETLGLAGLYAAQAATELAGNAYVLQRTFDAGGAEAVREHLQLKAESWNQMWRNHWKVAAYRALAASDWFCTSGGMHQASWAAAPSTASQHI